nr:AlNc14C255G9722 [Albugo laibachii Nc14]|eukprot:CCA24739.1 AlNc14C255G9722 [Albugo laibachii Nc14]
MADMILHLSNCYELQESVVVICILRNAVSGAVHGNFQTRPEIDVRLSMDEFPRRNYACLQYMMKVSLHRNTHGKSI